MLVAKWGNSLAVRLPGALVKKLGLKEGDAVNIVSADKTKLTLEHDNTRADALKALRKYRWKMPPDYKFDREEAHERD
jgi:antitoxin MazE